MVRSKKILRGGANSLEATRNEETRLFERFRKQKGKYHDIFLKDYRNEELVFTEGLMFLKLPSEFVKLFDTELFSGIAERLDKKKLKLDKSLMSTIKQKISELGTRAQELGSKDQSYFLDSLKSKSRKRSPYIKDAANLSLKRDILEAFLQSFKNREIYKKYLAIKKAETRRKTTELNRLTNTRLPKLSSPSHNTTRRERTPVTSPSTLRRGTRANSYGRPVPVPSARKK